MAQTYGRYVVDQPGPPEVMRWTREPVRHAGSNEVRVRHEAIGVDFIDTQIRSGQMPAALPTGARALFDLIKTGHLRIKVGSSHPLLAASKAHVDLAAGRTVGSVVLIV